MSTVLTTPPRLLPRRGEGAVGSTFVFSPQILDVHRRSHQAVSSDALLYCCRIIRDSSREYASAMSTNLMNQEILMEILTSFSPLPFVFVTLRPVCPVCPSCHVPSGASDGFCCLGCCPRSMSSQNKVGTGMMMWKRPSTSLPTILSLVALSAKLLVPTTSSNIEVVVRGDQEAPCPPCEMFFTKLDVPLSSGETNYSQDLKLIERGEPKSGTGYAFEWGVGSLLHACNHLQQFFGEDSCTTELKISPNARLRDVTSCSFVFEPGRAVKGARCPCPEVQRWVLDYCTSEADGIHADPIECPYSPNPTNHLVGNPSQSIAIHKNKWQSVVVDCVSITVLPCLINPSKTFSIVAKRSRSSLPAMNHRTQSSFVVNRSPSFSIVANRYCDTGHGT